MTTILSQQADMDLQTILDMQVEMPFGGGGFPNAPMDPKLANEARKRLESEFSTEEISRGLAWMTDKREGRSLREF